ncbi:palmitoyltransferase ZDHHC12-B-like isoform X2 [Oscarella lobularis]|uniref:palmitoyltransferase ZDHHC12-B-like isoform X2 n=1 Tax=Oscarella lobularis TaxID=121494 RepID=UPI00331334D1
MGCFSDGFAVRTFHCVLTLLIFGSLLVQDTELNRALQEKRYRAPAAMLLLVLLSIAFYFISSNMNPGFVTRDDAKIEGYRALVQSNREKSSPSSQSFAYSPQLCDICLVVQPVRAKHCLDCNRCVRRYDHHCPWIANCVGERNHRYYVIFLIVESVLVCWALKITCSAVVQRDTWSQWVYTNFIYTLDILVLLCGALSVLLLVICHVYLIATGLTTWEFVKHTRISYLKAYSECESPFDEGVISNFVTFFCYCKLKDWAPYLKGKRVRRNSASSLV